MVTYDYFQKRLKQLREELKTVCDRCGRKDFEQIEILPVTKNQPAEVLNWVLESGLKRVGENRVQEATEKKKSNPVPLVWDLIGHLQSNKVNMAIQVFDRIQSIDSIALAKKVNSALERRKEEELRIVAERYPILLQVNTAEDSHKHGCTVEEVYPLLEVILKECNHLRVEGLMTIGPLTEDKGVVRKAFAALRVVRDELEERFGEKLPTLSMGMSDDWMIAVEEGSTLLRIGSYLLGQR